MSNLFRSPLAHYPASTPPTGRYVAFGRMIGRRQFYFIYDRQARGEILGRWETRESARIHADELNKQEREQR